MNKTRSVAAGSTSAPRVRRKSGNDAGVGLIPGIRELLDRLSQPAVVLDNGGLIVQCNVPMAALLESTPGDLRGWPIERFVLAASRRGLADLLSKATRPEATPRDISLRSLGGKLVPISASVSPLNSGEMCLLGLDLRPHLLAQEMQDAGRLMRAILHQASEAIVVCNSRGRVVRASHAAYELSSGVPVGKAVDNAFALEVDGSGPYRSAWRGSDSLLGVVLSGLTFGGVEGRIVLPRGEARHVLISGRPMRLAAGQDPMAVFVLTDITDRKKAERAREESERRYRALVDSLPEAILVVQEGKITFGNPSAVTLLAGREGGDLVGRGIIEIFRDGIPDLLPLQETTLRQLDGTSVEVEALGTRFTYDGRPALQLIVRDISERKRSQEEIQSLNRDLERRVKERTRQLADTVRDLNGFTYSVAHDLRAPLRAMQGFSTALLEDYRDRLDESGMEYARRISLASERMDALINDLLSYSRLTQSEFQPERVDVEKVFQEATTQLQAAIAERQADVRVDLPLSAVLGHGSTLVVILTNLLSNAIKFVAPGVRPRVVVRTAPAGRFVRLWVEDNGIGIAPEHQSRIFRMFERLHPRDSYPGTGMGLAIVKRAAERMGGACGVESAAGKGSRFWVDLLPAPEERIA